MQTVYFLGKLSGANRKDAAEIVRHAGQHVAVRLDADVNLIVVGEEALLKKDWNLWNDQLDADTRDAFEKGRLTIISETQFWAMYCGQDDGNQSAESSQTLYTPSMLAKLTGLTLPIIRRLQREGLLNPARQIFRLCYFDKETLLPLKLMQNMLDAGLSLPTAIDRLWKMQRCKPARFSSVQIEGKDIIFHSENGPIDQNGQKRLPFIGEDCTDEIECESMPDAVAPLAVLDSIFEPTPLNDPSTLCEAACELETLGNLQGAADLYRAALFAGGPNPQINFLLAEVLYRQGELAAACERYFSAIELDEHFVEARSNLGCVLVELGRDDLAASAFRGALKLHPGYAEVHYHLGRLLQRQGRLDEAEEHFRLFGESTESGIE